ncbi:hypothetical protein AVEN_183742-1, partial [Araneus ventricosus]
DMECSLYRKRTLGGLEDEMKRDVKPRVEDAGSFA